MRGMENSGDDEDIDPDIYGVDWEAYDDPVLMRHIAENNPEDQEEEGEGLSEDNYEPLDCPFSDDLADELELRLNNNADFSRNMTVRRFLWQRALQICHDLQAENGLGR
jgi:hypothetical protein